MREMLLVGNPNTGKTTLYNTLTHSDEHVGNWHGVTVDSKNKIIKHHGEEMMLVDLPGLYSTTALSFEEQLSVDWLMEKRETQILNVCDINHLRQNLYLTLQLLEMGKRIVLCINDTNKERIKSKLNFEKLSNILGVPIVFVNFQKKESKKILGYTNEIDSVFKIDYITEKKLDEIEKVIEKNCIENNLDKTWCGIKLLENDDKIAKKLKINDEKLKIISKIKPEHSCLNISSMRYKRIDEILKECEYVQTNKQKNLSKFDKIATHEFFGLLLFLLTMLIVFYITFFSVGEILSELIKGGLNATLGKWLLLLTKNSPLWIKDLFLVGLLGGISSLLGFLPQIVLLFLFLSIMEETGYMSRVAYLFDDFFSKIGLSGKSAYTLIMGFGCASSSIMTSRNMEDKNSKIKTALISPYMSCSAKLPIYLVIGGAFFSEYNVFIIMLLYLLGIIVSILVSFFLEKTFLKSSTQSFVLEFPEIRMPGLKKVFKMVWKNLIQFLTRVGTLLVFINIIVWVLQSFSFSFEFVALTGDKSMLESLGQILCPIFKPLGFGSWGAVSSLLAGVIAKEIVVSSIAIFNGISLHDRSGFSKSILNPESAVHFTPASCMSFLVFSLLYMPCISSMSVLRHEVGRKWTIIGIIIQFIVAYVCAFVLYTLFLVFTIATKWKIILVFSILLIIISLLIIFYKIKNKKVGCLSCNGVCNKKRCKR